MNVIKNLYGWFNIFEHKPEYDPTTNSPCIVCGEHLSIKPIKTVSFLHGNRSYFYRIHKDCLTDEKATEIESTVVDIEKLNEVMK